MVKEQFKLGPVSYELLPDFHILEEDHLTWKSIKILEDGRKRETSEVHCDATSKPKDIRRGIQRALDQKACCDCFKLASAKWNSAIYASE